MEALNTQLLRVFDWLLWTTIQGSVLIILIVLIQLILRRRLPVRWHYLLWGLLLIRLAVPWLPESRWSVFNLVPRSVQQGRIIESFSQSRNADRTGFYMRARFAGSPQTTDETETTFVRLVRAVPMLWLLGTLAIGAYVCVRNISLWRTIKRERPITSSEILDLLEDCKMQMGVETIIGVVVSDQIKSPALFGFVRPRLLLPQGMLETYGQEELRYVFIHELAHLKQRDIYLGWLMALLHIAHWFNPLMWFAFGRMRADRELACDSLAISKMDSDEPPRYGRTIVSLLESFSQAGYLPSVAGILEDTCQIERRIKMITDYKKTSRKHRIGAMLFVAALACVVLTNAYVAKADFEFGEPVNLKSVIPVIDPAHDSIDCFCFDGQEIYIESDKQNGGYGDFDIWVVKRPTPNSDWNAPENLGPVVNSPNGDAHASISGDGLELYFCSGRPGGYGAFDIYMTTRTTKDAPWEPPVNLGSKVNSSAVEASPWISAEGLELTFSSWRDGGYGGADIYVTRREATNEPWDEPVNLGPLVNSAYNEYDLSLSSDGLLLFFDDPELVRPGGYGAGDMWMAKRVNLSSPWQLPVNLGPRVNSPLMDAMPRLAPDGRTLYFITLHEETYDNWKASILPVCDFNADGIVDCADICMMMEYWDTNEPLYDIAPVPFGDGVVDVQDLIVLTEHLTKSQAEPNAVKP